MERDDIVPEDGAVLEGELIGADAVPATTRPPGRKPVAPLHLIAPLTAEEISMLISDPNEVIRRRTADYLNWAHALVSASPSRLNRVAFGVESQRRMVDKLLSLAVPPAHRRRSVRRNGRQQRRRAPGYPGLVGAGSESLSTSSARVETSKDKS
jgi:hypothetical protein